MSFLPSHRVLLSKFIDRNGNVKEVWQIFYKRAKANMVFIAEYTDFENDC